MTTTLTPTLLLPRRMGLLEAAAACASFAVTRRHVIGDDVPRALAGPADPRIAWIVPATQTEQRCPTDRGAMFEVAVTATVAP